MPDRLTVLLTNIWLVNRAGSETVIRDLAFGLLRRGHRVIVYAPALGGAADELVARGIVVIDDLRKLAETPDIIHAHHLIPCGEALYRFPQTPAIYTCHSFSHWAEAPAHFPQVAAYVAVDEACRDRLVQAEGIDPARVMVIPNAVDLTRIPQRPQPLAARPLRAVAFGKAAAAGAPRLACERLGIPFAAIGTLDVPLANPESELVKADLVFASARCALESLCCGCAVIACDARGIAGLVTSENYQDLRAKNFGLRTLTESNTIEACIREIGRYDPQDASRVSARARHDAGLALQLDRFETLYREVLDGSRRPRITPEAHERAMAQFLHDNLPRRPADIRWPWLALREELRRDVLQLEARLGEAQDRLAASEAQLTATVTQVTQARGELDQARVELALSRAELTQSRSEMAATSGKLAILRQSRLLKVGRLLRRIAGRPVAY